MRLGLILRAPGPDDAGGGGGPALGDPVTIPRAEWDELRARAALAADGLESREGWASKLQARDEAHARALSEAEKKADALDRAYKSALKERDLATALAGRPLVSGAVSQLIRLIGDDFEVVDDGGRPRVVSKDGRGVAEAVDAHLADASFAHFSLPSSRGGTSVKGQIRSASPASPAPAGQPRTLGDAVLQQWKEASARSAGQARSMGLGRSR